MWKGGSQLSSLLLFRPKGTRSRHPSRAQGKPLVYHLRTIVLRQLSSLPPQLSNMERLTQPTIFLRAFRLIRFNRAFKAYILKVNR